MAAVNACGCGCGTMRQNEMRCNWVLSFSGFFFIVDLLRKWSSTLSPWRNLTHSPWYILRCQTCTNMWLILVDPNKTFSTHMVPNNFLLVADVFRWDIKIWYLQMPTIIITEICSSISFSILYLIMVLCQLVSHTHHHQYHHQHRNLMRSHEHLLCFSVVFLVIAICCCRPRFLFLSWLFRIVFACLRVYDFLFLSILPLLLVLQKHGFTTEKLPEMK